MTAVYRCCGGKEEEGVDTNGTAVLPQPILPNLSFSISLIFSIFTVIQG